MLRNFFLKASTKNRPWWGCDVRGHSWWFWQRHKGSALVRYPKWEGDQSFSALPLTAQTSTQKLYRFVVRIGWRQMDSPHPLQEVLLLLCFLNQTCSAIICDVLPQKLRAADQLHSSVDEKFLQLMNSSCSWNDVLDWFYLYLLSVGQVVAAPNKTHHRSVICIFHNVIGGSSGGAVVCHENEQQRT